MIAPVAFAALWGALVSPRARVKLSGAARFAVELTLFGTAAVALAAAGRGEWAVALFVLAVLSGVVDRVAR